MKNLKTCVFLLLLPFVFTGCKKLKRDNPLDNQNPDYGKPSPSGTLTPNMAFEKLEVTADNNSDKIINKGEDATLKIYLKNTGTGTASGVTARIICSSSYVIINSPGDYVTYGYLGTGDVAPGKEAYADYNDLLSLNVSALTPDGTVLSFTLNIKDQDNNQWTSNFSVTVQHTGANLVVSHTAVYADDNHNGLVNPGETIQVKVFLNNTGTSNALGVRAVATSTSNYVHDLAPGLPGQYCYLGSTINDYINAGQEGTSINGVTWYPTFTVPAATPVGTVLNFAVLITDETSNSWTRSFSLTVN